MPPLPPRRRSATARAAPLRGAVVGPAGKFEIRLRYRDIPRKTLVADLRRVAGDTAAGAALTIALYAATGRFAPGTVTRRFGSWNAALAAAGLPVRHLWNAPDAALLANLAEVWRKLGRQPRGRELTRLDGLSRFSYSTYKSRFGSWHKALRAFARFIGAGGQAAQGDKGRRRRRVRSPRNIGWSLRATVLLRDHCRCRMCGASPARDGGVTLHVDHVEPWARGGETVLDNLQTLCATCNIGKGARPILSSPRAAGGGGAKRRRGHDS